MHDFANSLVTI